MSLINLSRGIFLGAALVSCGAIAFAAGLRAESVTAAAPARTGFAAALHAALADPEASAFYAARGDAPLWTDAAGARDQAKAQQAASQLEEKLLAT